MDRGFGYFPYSAIASILNLDQRACNHPNSKPRAAVGWRTVAERILLRIGNRSKKKQQKIHRRG
jgi:hypothetical protein